MCRASKINQSSPLGFACARSSSDRPNWCRFLPCDNINLARAGDTTGAFPARGCRFKWMIAYVGCSGGSLWTCLYQCKRRCAAKRDAGGYWLRTRSEMLETCHFIHSIVRSSLMSKLSILWDMVLVNPDFCFIQKDGRISLYHLYHGGEEGGCGVGGWR